MIIWMSIMQLAGNIQYNISNVIWIIILINIGEMAEANNVCNDMSIHSTIFC